MAEGQMKLRGYFNGTPIFECPDPPMLSKAKVKDLLLGILDIMLIFPNGKTYFEYTDDELFMAKKNKAGGSEPDLSFLFKVDENGDVVSKRPFDILKG